MQVGETPLRRLQAARRGSAGDIDDLDVLRTAPNPTCAVRRTSLTPTPGTSWIRSGRSACSTTSSDLRAARSAPSLQSAVAPTASTIEPATAMMATTGAATAAVIRLLVRARSRARCAAGSRRATVAPAYAASSV